MGMAYCMKCKSKKEVLEGYLDYYKNGTPVEKGKCSGCGGKTNRILNREERLLLKEGNLHINSKDPLQGPPPHE